MKATLKITIVIEVDGEDRDFLKEALYEDGDITAIYEFFEPETNGKHELTFED